MSPENSLLTQVRGQAGPVLGALRAKGLAADQIREIVSCLLLLRWIDQMEVGRQEMTPVLQRERYTKLTRPLFQRDRWEGSGRSSEQKQRLRELGAALQGVHPDAGSPVGWIPRLGEALQQLAKVNAGPLKELALAVGALPFELPAHRHEVLEVVDALFDEFGPSSEGDHATRIEVARLVAAVANPQPGERIHDPCFGIGNFLISAWLHAGRTQLQSGGRPGAKLEVSGVEVNGGAFLAGLARMLLAGIEGARLVHADALKTPWMSDPVHDGFDLVLAAPPLGAQMKVDAWRLERLGLTTSDSTSVFIQHALAQLKPSGRAVILVPEGFLFRAGGIGALRRHLLRNGLVESVTGLPGGALDAHLRIKSALLVLRRRGGADRVRMVDAGLPGTTRPSHGVRAQMLDAELEQLADTIRNPEWGSASRSADSAVPDTSTVRPVWYVSVGELEAASWDLTVRRREGGGLGSTMERLEAALGRPVPLSSVAQVIPGRVAKPEELADAPPGPGAVGYIRPSDLNREGIARLSMWLRSEAARGQERLRLRAGDILLPRSGWTGRASLVLEGAAGAVAGAALYVLRVNEEKIDPRFLLAYLETPFCREWLDANVRGATLRHLDRAVLDMLPVLLPALPMQAAAARQHRELKTDVLTFLEHATGTESDRLSLQLAELSNQIPPPDAAADLGPSLEVLQSLASKGMLRQEGQDGRAGGSPALWLLSLTDALRSFEGIASVPPGPALLSVLQETERNILRTLEQARQQLPVERQARAICDRLLARVRAITEVLARAELRIGRTPPSLRGAGPVDFTLEFVNAGPLPLRNLRIESAPDWGVGERVFLEEGGTLSLALHGELPKDADGLSLRFAWRAVTLMGGTVSGAMDWAVQVAAPGQVEEAPGADLGGSPYVTGSPLAPQHGHNVFFGREELLRRISRLIAASGNVVLLEGNRRAGKTSILRHLEGRDAVPGWLAAYCSLQGAGGAKHVAGLPTEEVFREMAGRIAAALHTLGGDVPLPNGKIMPAGSRALGMGRASAEGISAESAFSDFRDYLEVVLSTLEPTGLGLLLMLDEFDKLQEGIDNGVTSPNLPGNIRSLIQAYPRFSAILTGSRRLKRLREEYWSALYGLGTTLSVTALDAESARRVVVEPVRGRLKFSDDAVERVLDLTARQPFLLQCLCHRVFEQAQQNSTRSITLSNVNDAARDLVRDNEHFASLWDYAALGPATGRMRRQMILLLCARSFRPGSHDAHVSFGMLQEQLVQAGIDVQAEALDADLAYLRELELIDLRGEIGDSQYQLAVPLMSDWIGQQQDSDVVVNRARAEAEEEDGGSVLDTQL